MQMAIAIRSVWENPNFPPMCEFSGTYPMRYLCPSASLHRNKCVKIEFLSSLMRNILLKNAVQMYFCILFLQSDSQRMGGSILFGKIRDKLSRFVKELLIWHSFAFSFVR